MQAHRQPVILCGQCPQIVDSYQKTPNYSLMMVWQSCVVGVRVIDVCQQTRIEIHRKKIPMLELNAANLQGQKCTTK